MATKKYNVTAGPSEMQLMQSLMRGSEQGPFAIEMDKATSVHFTYADFADATAIKGGFSCSIRTLSRTDRSGHRWYVEGDVVGDDKLISFVGRYDTRQRTGIISLRSKN
jgi:hypothetical protein